jgi:hypothetical protein
MACQWRQVATGRNRSAAMGQKQSIIWRKLATAEVEIERMAVQTRPIAQYWKSKPTMPAAGTAGKKGRGS